MKTVTGRMFVLSEVVNEEDSNGLTGYSDQAVEDGGPFPILDSNARRRPVDKITETSSKEG